VIEGVKLKISKYFSASKIAVRRITKISTLTKLLINCHQFTYPSKCRVQSEK
jgi:hypothetical protein